jgi:hypothetical protein
VSDRDPSIPSDDELREFLASRTPEPEPLDRFPTAYSRAPAIVVYRQEMKLRQVELALGLPLDPGEPRIGDA